MKNGDKKLKIRVHPYEMLSPTQFDILMKFHVNKESEEAIRQYLVDENEGVEGGLTLDEIDEAMTIISR